MNEDQGALLVGVIELLGKEKVYRARADALSHLGRESLEFTTKLLGGELRIELVFDERPKVPSDLDRAPAPKRT